MTTWPRTSARLRIVLVTEGLPLDPTAMSASTLSLSMRTSTVAKSMPALQRQVTAAMSGQKGHDRCQAYASMHWMFVVL